MANLITDLKQKASKAQRKVTAFKLLTLLLTTALLAQSYFLHCEESKTQLLESYILEQQAQADDLHLKISLLQFQASEQDKMLKVAYPKWDGEFITLQETKR